MNLQKMIEELQAERNRLDEAILALERLSTTPGKRGGRVPRSAKDGSTTPSGGETGGEAADNVSKSVS